MCFNSHDQEGTLLCRTTQFRARNAEADSDPAVRVTRISPLGEEVRPMLSGMGHPGGLRPGLRERARLEWWVGDGGDPAGLVAGFLGEQGMKFTYPDYASP